MSGNLLIKLEPNDVAATPTLQEGLEREHQVFGFFFQLDVAVAQHAEHAAANDLKTREEFRK